MYSANVKDIENLVRSRKFESNQCEWSMGHFCWWQMLEIKVVDEKWRLLNVEKKLNSCVAFYLKIEWSLFFAILACFLPHDELLWANDSERNWAGNSKFVWPIEVVWIWTTSWCYQLSEFLSCSLRKMGSAYFRLKNEASIIKKQWPRNC